MISWYLIISSISLTVNLYVRASDFLFIDIVRVTELNTQLPIVVLQVIRGVFSGSR